MTAWRRQHRMAGASKFVERPRWPLRPVVGAAQSSRRTLARDVGEYLKVRLAPNMPGFANADKLPPLTMVGATRRFNPELPVAIDPMAMVES